jgi:hypothetical protein
MIRGISRRRPVSYALNNNIKLNAGQVHLFKGLNAISSNVPEYLAHIQTETYCPPCPPQVLSVIQPDCTIPNQKYQDLLDELTALNTLFASTGTSITDILTGLS